MIHGKCNLKIVGLYPFREGIVSYGFSAGIAKEFAKRAYESELSEIEVSDFQEQARTMIKEVFQEDITNNPYIFFENQDGKLTRLVRNLTVPGDACGLDILSSNLEKELAETDEPGRFIKYISHNVDSSIQAYALLSLMIEWENTTEAMLYLKI